MAYQESRLVAPQNGDVDSEVPRGADHNRCLSEDRRELPRSVYAPETETHEIEQGPSELEFIQAPSREQASAGHNVHFSPDPAIHTQDPPSPVLRNAHNTHRRHKSEDLAILNATAREHKPGYIIAKLRALGSSSNLSAQAESPKRLGGTLNHLPPQVPDTLDNNAPQAPGQSTPPGSSISSSSDADVEFNGAEDRDHQPGEQDMKRRRQVRTSRPGDNGSQSAPSSPKYGRLRPSRPYLFSSNSAASGRRSSDGRQAVSGDEGYERTSRGSPWRQGSSWIVPRTFALRNERNHSIPHGDDRRPTALRRLTGRASSGDLQFSQPSSPWRSHRAERAKIVSSAKWRQVKAGLRAIGQRRKAENKVDQAKSAELLAELTAGAPAALLLASMFQRDEHGNKRVPILLEQLKVHITDSRPVDGDRHMVFQIELEYGNGLTRMKWTIHRALRDFANLHARYKVQISAAKYVKLKGDDARSRLPHFPRSAFPYLRGFRGIDDSDSSDHDAEITDVSGGDGSGAERTARKRKKHRPGLKDRRKSSIATLNNADGVSAQARRDNYAERQRKKLEIYLQQMIRYLILRPESNRLCRFLELSAIGVRLSAEGSYHGKEGLLAIKSGKGMDFRRAWRPNFIADRHSPKWFAVRHSYIVCVDSPEAMNIYDVFLLDAHFRVSAKRPRIRDQQKASDIAKAAGTSAAHPQHHSLKVFNSERKLKLLAKNERQLQQFQESIAHMSENSEWSKPKRFGSFAPIREKVFAQWLVDGRDYMWNVSRAISMAKDVIYIHDWWLSPELYMRRPAAISQKWRLDRLLQRKAREGVKVFVIMYRNINSAIPIDSEYSKFSLLDLHPNIFVQRSPNQFRQNTFFWAHHEKLCLIDHMIAFIGGIDLCFGRWDTPQHSVVDDKITGFEATDAPKDADHCQLWPGKDYSNPRVQDFYALDRPYEEMYDRAKVPRMPWHDIHMQIVGQPARDLTRHFVQRWNYILRQRKPTRPTPFLLPPPDFDSGELEALGLNGTCEIQILRSACEWSLGTPGITECSILNAYVKLIEQSDHFIYVENQFFISSCEVEGTRMENTIGDALVERIIRAAETNRAWRAVIVIPLMPGFQNTVAEQDGTSVRLIMQCQYRSICRGEASIFGRLRAAGLEPEDYIQFYSLRAWGKIGPTKQLVTEQLYIHAKCMIVDDRAAIIGSANINERSMLGSRDSECAAIIRDTDLLESSMNGQSYMVGRFPHSLRMRLMREHLGLDVDQTKEDHVVRDQEGYFDHEPEAATERSTEEIPNDTATRDVESLPVSTREQKHEDVLLRNETLPSFNGDVDWEQAENPHIITNRKKTEDSRVTGNVEHRNSVDGEGHDAMKYHLQTGDALLRDSAFVEGGDGTKEVLIGAESSRPEGKDAQATSEAPSTIPGTPLLATEFQDGQSVIPTATRVTLERPSKDRAQRNEQEKLSSSIPFPDQDCSFTTNDRKASNVRYPTIEDDCMRDPLLDSFLQEKWHLVAENNTRLFRQVFRCMPDNEVKNWKEYKEYAAYAERFSQSQGGGKSKDTIQQDASGTSGPPGANGIADRLRALGPLGEAIDSAEEETEKFRSKIADPRHHDNHAQEIRSESKPPQGTVEDWAKDAEKQGQARTDTDVDAKTGDLRRDANPATEYANEKAVPLPLTAQQYTDPSKLVAGQIPDPGASIERASTMKSTTCSPHTQIHLSESLAHQSSTRTTKPATVTAATANRRRRRATTRSSRRDFSASDEIMSKSEAETLMSAVQGHLVLWPYDWLNKEEQGGNWLYSIDGLAPLEIYS